MSRQRKTARYSFRVETKILARLKQKAADVNVTLGDLLVTCALAAMPWLDNYKTYCITAVEAAETMEDENDDTD